MKSINLTKELYEYIKNECKKHKVKTLCNVDFIDVLYSYLYSTDNEFSTLNEWDDFWGIYPNGHPAITFIKEMCKKIDNYKNN